MKKLFLKTVLGYMWLMGALAIGSVNAQEINKDIVIDATSTAANQRITINKYFANAYTVDWGDGSPVQNLTADTGHTYSVASGYTIKLSLSGATRWTFTSVYKPLVPTNGTTVTGVKITYMPSLSGGFGANATNPGNYYFQYFNYKGALTSLPDNSFDTSNITTAGNSFFDNFNESGALASLPDNSFDTSNITKAGNYFFYCFNERGKLTSLPDNSFDTSNIAKAGNYFFGGFNYEGQLISLPDDSFDIHNIISVGDSFFVSFNYKGKLTSLPDKSFDISNITKVGRYFFANFNMIGKLSSLPENSFILSTGLTTVGSDFFSSFNVDGQLTSLPIDSFDTSNITSAGSYFFSHFNRNGKITDLPSSFKLNSLGASVTNGYFNAFNSPDYTLNRKVSELVTGVTVPSTDKDTFSDNQPGRCGVHPNWLVNPNACYVIYDANGGTGTTTGGYVSNATGVTVGSGIILPTKEGYTLSGWYDASGNKVDEILFPDMDGQTLYANWILTNYEIRYDLGGGIIIGNIENITGYTIDSEEIILVNPIKTGYTFTGWSGTNLDGISITVTIPSGSTGDRNFEANWEINQYTITLDIDGTLTVITGDYGSPISKPSNPEKNGYRFVGWEPEIPDTIPAEDMTVKAKWEKLGSSGGGGGGGGNSSNKTETGNNANTQTGKQINSNTGDTVSTGTNFKELETNTGSNAQTGSQVDSSEQTPQNDSNTSMDSSTSSQNDGKTYTPEFQEAYEFAKGHGITTMPTIQKADMNGKLTRIAMAKMLSQYAMNVLGQKPSEIEVPNFNDVTDKQNSDYDGGVTLAYQLGIMGQNMPNNNFRPNDEVTRAEFTTALSRMIYSTTDGQYKSTPEYYVNHMKKLKEEGIITKADPKMKELRGYVMIMLMRSAK